MADQRDPNTKYGVNFKPAPLDKADEDVVRRIFGDHCIVLTNRPDRPTEVYRFVPGMLLFGPLQRFIAAVITSPLLLHFGPGEHEAEGREAWEIIKQWREDTESSSDGQ